MYKKRGGIGNDKQRDRNVAQNDNTSGLIYLRKEKEDTAGHYSHNYEKLLEIFEEMTTLNMMLLKGNACL